MEEDFIYSFTICGIYQITHVIGNSGTAGSGVVSKGLNILTGSEVAVKFGRIPVSPVSPCVLAYEADIYKLLRGAPEGIPKIHWSGVDGNHHVIVMDLLGPTLTTLKRVNRGSMTAHTICMLAEQLISRIQFLHSRGIVWGDVKPHNIAMGTGANSQIVHIFDFGHAQLFINPSSGEHIPFRIGRRVFGTPRYASIAAHNDHEVSRKDDIESLLYVLVELFQAELPWQGIAQTIDEAALDRICALKAGPEFREFLSKSMPELKDYHEYCSELTFGQTPDYAYLKGLFRERMRREGWSHDWRYDWVGYSSFNKGSLLPGEFVHDIDFVERQALDPE